MMCALTYTPVAIWITSVAFFFLRELSIIPTYYAFETKNEFKLRVALIACFCEKKTCIFPFLHEEKLFTLGNGI